MWHKLQNFVIDMMVLVLLTPLQKSAVRPVLKEDPGYLWGGWRWNELLREKLSCQYESSIENSGLNELSWGVCVGWWIGHLGRRSRSRMSARASCWVSGDMKMKESRRKDRAWREGRQSTDMEQISWITKEPNMEEWPEQSFLVSSKWITRRFQQGIPRREHRRISKSVKENTHKNTWVLTETWSLWHMVNNTQARKIW